MTEEAAFPSPDQTYDFGGGSTSYEQNPWVARTIGREAFYLGAKRGDKSEDMKRDGEARCFIMRRPQFHNLYGGVQFWMQVGLRDDLSVIAVPFYSAARLNEGWQYKSKKSGKWVLGIQNGPKSCPLAQLVKKRPDLISPLKFKGQIQYWPARDGQPAEAKRDYRKLFAVEVFEVLFEYAEVPDPAKPGQTKRVVVIDQTTKKAKYTIDPRPYIWEVNEPWWEQLRSKVLAPNFAQSLEPQVADIDGEQAAKPPKKLPEAANGDPSKIVLKLFAKTDEKDPSRASYLVDFSPSMVLDSSSIAVVDPLPETGDGRIDWNQIFPPMTQEQADEVLAKADGLESSQPEGDHSASSSQGAAPQAHTPPPSTDDDIPF